MFLPKDLEYTMAQYARYGWHMLVGISRLSIPNSDFGYICNRKTQKEMNRKSRFVENITTEPYLWKRMLAGFIDYSIIIIFFFAYVYAFGDQQSNGEYRIYGLSALPPLFFWGIMTIGIEQWFGATLGNQMVGLRPYSINGESRVLSFGQSLKRHLLDFIDLSFFGITGIIVISKSERHQRIGDIWAETTVIKDETE
jgi:uncharacterized RDD family membrane protein YckC